MDTLYTSKDRKVHFSNMSMYVLAIRSYETDERKSFELLKYQVELFNKVVDVMGLVDLPRTFWDKTKEKMEQELENVRKNLQENTAATKVENTLNQQFEQKLEIS